ncbi:Archaeophage PsiM2, terminase large subunit [uncultured Caudovirales phage]|uniref:Archaeophage PsiM2, terminase large subunit n=1 Tax=uncultured Caudovirales phage TaxID=2100421 RepID=A0A6J5PBQ9_9CAUD|nr:Archaeophage PsiM2, terminase large subunit [uncultured Caudovirales phage]
MDKKQAAIELLKRRQARKSFKAFVEYVRPKYKWSFFSETVCSAIDQFLIDCQNGLRPILVLAAPPQHGKSELASRLLPAYIMGAFPDHRLASASYSSELSGAMAQDVRRILVDNSYLNLFPKMAEKKKYDLNRIGEFNNPTGQGSYIGVGVGGGLTGRPVDIGIIDDAIKNEKEALSPTTKENIWNWYQATFNTRLSENSGQVIIGTQWAEDDIIGRIVSQFQGDSRLKILKFPAINLPDEVGYNQNYPEGALVPELKSLEFLQQIKKLFSDYWFSAMYQQCPRALGGNIFKEAGIRYYLTLPEKFDKIIISWDCTFKDTDGTDYVVGQAWGKVGANSYLLDQIRRRMSFTETLKSVVELRNRIPNVRETLIEDKANGPAVIDVLKASMPGMIPIDPDGSKLARAHAVTNLWESGNIHIPDPSIAPWIKEFIAEVTSFPVAAHDDQVDAMTQALRRLYPAFEKAPVPQVNPIPSTNFYGRR